MNLFNNSLEQLNAIASGKDIGSYTDIGALSFTTKNFSKSQVSEGLTGVSATDVLTIDKKGVTFDFTPLAELYGVNKFSIVSPTLGNHPDFSHLGMNEYEHHYAVSMFADIKGSTRLSGKYSLLQIRKMKDVILSTAIHIFSFFGGHIQRLQGDGIFVYFGRKGQNPNDAIISALNASSLLLQYMKTDIADYFEAQDIKPLRMRIGIDYGDKENVIWSRYGLPMCHELTTTSLHTDLAAKLQAKAQSNSIMIGDNVYQELDFPDEFRSIPAKPDGSPDYYIYQGHINYRNWEFDWEKYLHTFDFFKKSSDNKRLEYNVPTYRLACYYSDGTGSTRKIYYQNLFSLPKGKNLRFEIEENGHAFTKRDFQTIVWTVLNRGQEAKDAGQLEHDIRGIYKNLTYSETQTSFLGHHYMQCQIKSTTGHGNINIKFPVFIQ